ncbi:GTP 3',8-cyclase MoaA, partial [Escherichia coli]|nr:GTP 3',8-cyclase MoaA [Escherichia coli]
MPEHRAKVLPRDELLTFEEIAHIAEIFVELGIEKIRLTGGEPLVRREVPTLVRSLNKLRPG